MKLTKFMALLLAVVMIVSMLPSMAFAEEQAAEPVTPAAAEEAVQTEDTTAEETPAEDVPAEEEQELQPAA